METLGYLGQFVYVYLTIYITRLCREVRKLRIGFAAAQSGSMDNWNITDAVQVKTVDSGEPRACLVVFHLPFQLFSLLLTLFLTDSLFSSF